MSGQDAPIEVLDTYERRCGYLDEEVEDVEVEGPALIFSDADNSMYVGQVV